MASGIYSIDNIETGMVYVGQAMDIEKRWQQHLSELRGQRHPNRSLQAAWNEYGFGCFKLSVIERCSPENLTEREQHYLDTYMPLGFCYNMRRRAFTPASGIRPIKPIHKPENYIDPSSLDDVEKMIVKVYRKGGDIRVLCLLAAIAETENEFDEVMNSIQKKLAKRA